MSYRASADRARVVRPRRRSDPNCAAAVADVDHRLLAVLCEHRVVRQDQLQRLFPQVPERTLRYRTRQLHDLGLAGRSRPYRERGSAPNHHWPTRRADFLVRGEPLPRGGERHTPDPIFLAHAAALTELHVTLVTRAQAAGLELLIYRREGEARETFKETARERTLAPDATVFLLDEKNRKLGAFVEIDLGTMSHARLRFKASLYAAYAKSDAWRGHHLFLPALLFLTTTPARASRSLQALARALKGSAQSYSSRSRAPLVAAAGALALTPDRLLDEACLADLDGHDGLPLLDVLNDARVPHEEALTYWQAQDEAEEKERHHLFEDPEAMRTHLHRQEPLLDSYVHALGPVGAQAVKLLLASTAQPLPEEREVLQAIGRDLGDTLLEPGMSALPAPCAAVQGKMALLIDYYRSSQQKRLQALVGRHGEGPRLRRARKHLDDGGQLGPQTLTELAARAERDAAGHEQQHECRLAYLRWREHAARRLVRQAGPLGRLTVSREDFYPRLDREWLKTCARCEETIYPDFERNPDTYDERPRPACHYCGIAYAETPEDAYYNPAVWNECEVSR